MNRGSLSNMLSSKIILTTIVGCGLVTWLSRVLPIVLLKKIKLSEGVSEFLSFVPIVIMTTLWFSNLFTAHQGQSPQLNMDYALATIPTIISAIVTKSLLVIVVVGMASLAIIRMFN